MLCCFPLFAKFADEIGILLSDDPGPYMPVQVCAGIDDLVRYGG